MPKNSEEPRAIIVYQRPLRDNVNPLCNRMADWRKFKAKIKEKRVQKGRGKKKDMAVSWSQENDTLIIQ